MSKAKSTASSKTSSRLVRNQTVELVSRTVGPRFLGKNGRSEGTGTVFFFNRHQKGTFYGGEMAKIRMIAYIYTYINKYASFKFRGRDLKGFWLFSA